MKRINETQLQILEALNDYRFLTVNQMIRLGIASNKYTISKNTVALHSGKAPLIAYADFGTFPTLGRLPRLYYLVKPGAEWLAEAFQVEEEEINYPKGVKIFTRDYFHRVLTIDLHIEARRFASTILNMSFDFFHTYFEHTGANHTNDPKKPRRQTLTKVPIRDGFFIPDSIFQMTDPDGKRWMFTGEIYRGHTTKRTHQQLENHLYSLMEGSITKVYKYDRAVRVLVVCEEEGAMNALIKRLAGDSRFAQVEPFFLFKTVEGMQKNFAGDWLTFRGRKANMFVK